MGPTEQAAHLAVHSGAAGVSMADTLTVAQSAVRAASRREGELEAEMEAAVRRHQEHSGSTLIK